MAIIKTKPKIVFLITEDWYFWSHRLHLARTARDAGLEVIVATRVHKHKELIEKEGFKIIPIFKVRRSRNIIVELLNIVEIVKMYRIERPVTVFYVAIKPIFMVCGQQKLPEFHIRWISMQALALCI